VLIDRMPGSRRARALLEQDAELNLLVTCCRWPFNPADGNAVRRQAPVIDWARFGRLVRRHRVEGLVYRALRAAAVEQPPQLAEALRQRALQITADNLKSAAHCRVLVEAFAHASLRLLFVKGLTLGALAYGSIVPKASWDVDVLIASDELEAAARTLRQLGYRTVTPSSADVAALERWHRISKESLWTGPDGCSLELHSALADHPALIHSIGISSPRQTVEVATGVPLETLGHDELFAYLCVHGGSSAWFRLKWLADLAALLGGASEEETSRLYRRSRELGAGRASAAALLLAHHLFGTSVAPGDLKVWARDAGVRWLVHSSLRNLTGRRGEHELSRVPLGSIWIHLAQVAMVPSLGAKFAEIRRQFVLSRKTRADRLA
jgi:hypothetical protein